MKTILIPIVAILMLSACSNKGLYQVKSQPVQQKMKDIDKTDYAKVENNHKEKIERKRQDRYHSYAVDTDKKLNHQKNEEINQKKGWDGSFGFY